MHLLIDNIFLHSHTLEMLKRMDLEGCSMSKYIVYASNEVQAPLYMRTGTTLITLNDVRNRSMEFSPLIENDWPTAKLLGLDDSQFKAFRAGLTKEFSIIQGPPGTGKTYLGDLIILFFSVSRSKTISKLKLLNIFF